MSTEKIVKIEKRNYQGQVYNLEVEPNDAHEDDQYYVNADNGIVVHNCHPRDNIALRYMAEKLGLGYDLFGAIMESREVQAENLASKLVRLAVVDFNSGGRDLDIIIVGKAYKPLVPYDAGSSSMLVAHYVREMRGERDGIPVPTVHYLDETMGVFPPQEVLEKPAVYLMAHNPEITYGDQLDFVKEWYANHKVTESDEALTVATAAGTVLNFAAGSIVVDPWRKIPQLPGVRVVHYGNTRKDAPI